MWDPLLNNIIVIIIIVIFIIIIIIISTTRPRVSGTPEKLGVHLVPPCCFIVRQGTGHDFAISWDSLHFFFHSGERGLKNIRIRSRIRIMRVDGNRILK